MLVSQNQEGHLQHVRGDRPTRAQAVLTARYRLGALEHLGPVAGEAEGGAV